MYVTKNLFDDKARFIDIPDKDFFHYAINFAKDSYELTGDISPDQIDDFKKKYTMVIFASFVSNQTADDYYIKRKEMNKRAKRKYLIIDADFNEGEEKESEDFYNKCIEIANKHNTYLVIYPTASYPIKPRFRVVFFTKRALTEGSYNQAMQWLYDELETKPNDASDYKLKSNNNAPIFIHSDQINKIYDNTQEENLDFLDSSHWKHYPKPKVKKIKKASKDARDTISISADQYIIAMQRMIENHELDDYSEFWKFVYSLARAEFHGQLTESEIYEILEMATYAAPNEQTRLRWSADNKQLYSTSKNRLFSDEEILQKTRSIVTYDGFKEVLTGKG